MQVNPNILPIDIDEFRNAPSVSAEKGIFLDDTKDLQDLIKRGKIPDIDWTVFREYKEFRRFIKDNSVEELSKYTFAIDYYLDRDHTGSEAVSLLHYYRIKPTNVFFISSEDKYNEQMREHMFGNDDWMNEDDNPVSVKQTKTVGKVLYINMVKDVKFVPAVHSIILPAVIPSKDKMRGITYLSYLRKIKQEFGNLDMIISCDNKSINIQNLKACIK